MATLPVVDDTTLYAHKVVAGEIVAGPHVRNSCKRHLLDIETAANRGLIWEPESANRVFNFCRDVLVLSHGEFHGAPFNLHLSQKFIVGSIFGWKRISPTGKKVRRFTHAYVEQGKGNGKSPLMGALGMYMLTADGERGAQIFYVAASKEQAKIAFAFAVQMYEHSRALQKRVRAIGRVRVDQLVVRDPRDRGVCKPFSKDESRKSGIMPHAAFFDEVHEFPNDDMIDKIIAGAKSRTQPLFFMSTNSGFDRTSRCWELHQAAVRVAAGSHTLDDKDGVYDFKGEIIDDSFFSYVCALDKIEMVPRVQGEEIDNDKYWFNNQTCWVKVNPLLDATISSTWLKQQIIAAQNVPSRLPTVERLHFCIWNSAKTVWLSHHVINNALIEFDYISLRGKKAWIGCDLSSKNDLSSIFTIVEDDDGMLYGFDASFTPLDTIQARAERDQVPYVSWVKDGYLKACDGVFVDYMQMAQYIAELADIFDVKGIAYDSYAWNRFFMPCLEAYNIDIPLYSHPQAGLRKFRNKTDDDDNEPIELWMPSSLARVEYLLVAGKIKIKRNPVVIFAMSSATVATDTTENRYLTKSKSTGRIDAAIAMCMAAGLQHAMEQQRQYVSVYETGVSI